MPLQEFKKAVALPETSETTHDRGALIILDRIEAGYDRPVVGPVSLAIDRGEVVGVL